MSAANVERRVAATKADLADAIAERLREVIADAVASRGVAHVVLTGGSMGEASARALAPLDDIDWAHVHLWWGDERFLPTGDAERNETQARVVLIDVVGVPAANVHAMAASDGPDGDDLDAAVARYRDELATVAPQFDIVMLGMGPDTHVASLFPGHATTRVDDTSVVAENDSPKPPPQRISLTFPALNAAREVWLMIAGADKADAVRAASGSTDRTAHPASGVHGRERTIWWLDEAAAGPGA
ncbi:6-phosphogluconolactonase [Dermacoccus nishinomiyaensis]|uniref:6-phosphogluconolactonase n=1 Tax=Dermacoccus nishinomiyaensis TaxID=1274 RepID=A0A075JJ99_9MICO|nr:6-phosphogluconolactonase [Dermacoccus nishinomiyaensis]AIF41870.1 6-phosphogluconolactonase [Dermacoccus nishinomiyaensis]